MTTDAELLADAEGVLRDAEWFRWDETGPHCFKCGNAKKHGHAPGCELYRVLGAIKERRGDRWS